MKDKVVLITGGTSGIGSALVEQCLRKGARVAFTGRSASRNEETIALLRQKGLEAFGIEADAGSENDAFKAVSQTVNRFGKLDILINNAGISMRALFSELELGIFRQVMDTNFWGTVYTSKAALPYLIRSQGALVGISSVAGFKGLPGRTAYSASKFAMEGFLEALSLELKRKNVHVLIACPGFTASRIRENALTKSGSPQGVSPRDEGKMMSAETVAIRIITALEQKKTRIVMSKEGNLAWWLNKFFPGWVSEMTYRKLAAEPDSGLDP
jgi:dehydrogenase/reductase SDR family protein 7B